LQNEANLVAEIAAEIVAELSSANLTALISGAAHSSLAGSYLDSVASRYRQQEQRLTLVKAASRLATIDSVTSRELAFALAAAGDRRTCACIEAVWTGPSSVSTSMRGTEQVLLEVIEQAEAELLIVLYVAFDIRNIVDALDSAISRGVSVLVVAESIYPSTGEAKANPLASLSALIREKALIYHWPPESRDRDENGRMGCLHAKLAVADRKVVFVTSANLTGSALRENMEVGLRAIQKQLAETVVRQFQRMIDARVLVRLT